MKIMIHAVPQRMWYVNDFLIPMLKAQGAESITVWLDRERKGNLASCMEAFASCSGHGGTWHIQDDILPARNFVQRASDHDQGVVYGFCNEFFTDEPNCYGRVYAEDAWHSFQCVRIPDDYARACAAWLPGVKNRTDIKWMVDTGRMDDTIFRTWFLEEHGRERVENLWPNLVEHVDWLVGGSVLFEWRGFMTRAYHWDDEDLVRQLQEDIRAYKSR